LTVVELSNEYAVRRGVGQSAGNTGHDLVMDRFYCITFCGRF